MGDAILLILWIVAFALLWLTRYQFSRHLFWLSFAAMYLCILFITVSGSRRTADPTTLVIIPRSLELVFVFVGLVTLFVITVLAYSPSSPMSGDEKTQLVNGGIVGGLSGFVSIYTIVSMVSRNSKSARRIPGSHELTRPLSPSNAQNWRETGQSSETGIAVSQPTSLSLLDGELRRSYGFVNSWELVPILWLLFWVAMFTAVTLGGGFSDMPGDAMGRALAFVFTMLVLVVPAWLFFGLVSTVSYTVDDEGITKRSLLSKDVNIRWEEVKRVEFAQGVLSGFVLSAPDKKLKVYSRLHGAASFLDIAQRKINGNKRALPVRLGGGSQKGQT